MSKRHLTDMKPNEGYFEDFEANIMKKVMGNGFHLEMGISHPFKAPDQYFEDLESKLNELIQEKYTLLAGIGLPFKAPEGYFEQLEQSINTRTFKSSGLAENIPLPFAVPEGYFDQLDQKLLAFTIERSNLKEGISHPFKAPEGYFDDLESKILAKTKESASGSPFKKVYRNLTKYVSIAASIVMISVMGYLSYQKNAATNNSEIALKEIGSEALVAYLDSQNLTEYDLTLDGNIEIMDAQPVDLEELSDEELLMMIN